MSVTALSNLTVGSKASLHCKVTTARGITSSTQIMWTKNGTPVEEINDSRISIFPTNSTGTVHTSTLQFSYLSENDNGSEYFCRVTIRDTNTSGSVGLSSFHCKFILCKATYQ